MLKLHLDELQKTLFFLAHLLTWSQEMEQGSQLLRWTSASQSWFSVRTLQIGFIIEEYETSEATGHFLCKKIIFSFDINQMGPICPSLSQVYFEVRLEF